MTSSLACHSTEDLWQRRNCDSSESISSMSSGQSVGTPSSGQTNPDISRPHIRSSQSYPYIPPSTLSGRVHDPMPRSSLPTASLDTVPPSHVRGMDGSSPATAAVVQHVPFNFRPDSQDPGSAQNARLLGPHSRYPHGALAEEGRVEVGRSLSACDLPGGSPNAIHTSKQTTVTSEVRYRVGSSGATGELAGLTYSSSTSINMLGPEKGGAASLFPAVSSRHSSNAYISPQQVWLSQSQMPTTYVSSLSSSREHLPLATGASEPAVKQSSSSTCIPAHSSSTVTPRQNSNSPRASSEDVDSPEYINGM